MRASSKRLESMGASLFVRGGRAGERDQRFIKSVSVRLSLSRGEKRLPDRVVSGGQTGVDRAALDAARAAGVAVGGWCPKGRRAEDGRIPEEYPLAEAPTRRYDQRTRWNVRDSDGTAILHRGRFGRGTRLTARIAETLGKPLLWMDLGGPCAAPEVLRTWVQEHGVKVLNVAGPRESEDPGIYEDALVFLRRALEPEAGAVTASSDGLPA